MAQVPNNMTENPIKIYAAQFAQKDPLRLSARSGIPYDEKAQAFSLTLLGDKVQVFWPSMEARNVAANEAVDDKSRILCGRILLDGSLVPAMGKFLSYEEIPNGEQYYEPFHGRCIMRLAYMFRSTGQFAAACEKLGGHRVSSTADAAYEFDFLDGLLIRLLYWEADDEFGPNAQFMFSDNFLLAFTSDDIACAGDIILSALKACRA